MSKVVTFSKTSFFERAEWISSNSKDHDLPTQLLRGQEAALCPFSAWPDGFEPDSFWAPAGHFASQAKMAAELTPH